MKNYKNRSRDAWKQNKIRDANLSHMIFGSNLIRLKNLNKGSLEDHQELLKSPL